MNTDFKNLLHAAVVMTCAVFALASCGQDEHASSSKGHSQSNIAGGPGERTFDERYALKLKLPVAEGEFLQLLDRLHLKYWLDGERSRDVLIPAPYWNRNAPFDMKKIVRMFVVEGSFTERKVTERYRIYVDETNDVVYIENHFIYPPIG